jgi:signal transduction histidine kinase
MAALLYFVLLIIAYPHLTKLHELMARAAMIAILTAFATLTFFFIVTIFGRGAPPFTHVLVASFVIIISITPVKVILKQLFTAVYPESKDVFTSLYAFDERLEREKSLLLEEMAPVLAHEIRNPLGSIKSAAQYLKSEARGEEESNLLTVIIEEVDRLNDVVSQFLNYARPYELNLEMHNANRLVGKALSLIRLSHLADHVTIEEELRADIPLVKVDAEQITQVLLNMVMNAVEAMPAGGTLSIRTSKIESDTGEAVGISIRDTGKGMKKEEMKNIFKPFFTTKERGAGLGLAICQRIIRNHGGRIRVKSIPDRGSIFFIRLEGAR